VRVHIFLAGRKKKGATIKRKPQGEEERGRSLSEQEQGEEAQIKKDIIKL